MPDLIKGSDVFEGFKWLQVIFTGRKIARKLVIVRIKPQAVLSW